jgi:hypothetical protein
MPDAGKADWVETENGKWTSIGRLNSFVMLVFDAGDKTSGINLIKATKEILKREGL